MTFPRRTVEDAGAAGQQRLDYDLARRVLNYLSRRGVFALDSIQLTVSDGNVLLVGTVGSYSAKRRCRECCRCVAGVLNVVDRLVVAAAKAD